MRPNNHLRSSLCVLSLCAALSAQRSEGPYLGFPLHSLVGPNTFASGSSLPMPRQQQYAKEAGFNPMIATAPTGPANPRFTTAAMFGAVPPGFFVDAISSGYNYVFANPTTLQLDMGGRWGALLWSVTRNSTGAPGSLLHDEATRAGGEGAAADLFSMILPGSALPAPLSCFPIGVPQRATDSSQMGFVLGPAGQKPEMADFDPFLSMYDDGPPVRAHLTDDPWIYFSLSNGSLADPAVQAFVAPWFATDPAATSGATILRMQWQSTATPARWTTPEIHLTNTALGLTDPNDDIDALAVDATQRLLLLSLRYDPARPSLDRQLMIASWVGAPFSGPGTPATAYSYPTPSGPRRVADVTGIVTTDDIDAVCSDDPGNGAAVPLTRGYITYCGMPMGPGLPVDLEASVHRGTPVGPGLSSYYVSVDGFMGLTDMPDLVALFLSLPAPSGLPYGGPAVTLYIGPPRRPLGYDTFVYSLPLRPQTQTWGAMLDFQWGALRGPTIVVSPILRIRA